MSTAVATAAPQPTSLLSKIAARFSVEPNKMLGTLKATAFRVKDADVTNEQMMALLIVADQYGLNPFTKEIFAFPDRQNGIVPVVGVDGWSRIINEHAQFDGMEFAQDDVACTCTIYRKDRSHPVSVTEYMDECRRNVGPWQTHPRRMLRHKALIQCARLAFGYTGIYDQDEAERIVERDITPASEDARPASGVARLKNALKKTEPATEGPGEDRPPEEPADPAPQSSATVIDHIAKLDELTSLEAIEEYASALHETVRADERFAKAVKRRLDSFKKK